ncbi:hypothetical protein ACIPSA_32925 [Streptomyces sp. NPDC086549]|uniref:hypothetical protein n=1 Tax=Streptomyces sp. NPDC086549 TaxID=3365752 RepID=UPI003807AE49
MTNEGGRYWNEETQRWEDGKREAAHATPPPPARPDHAPAPPPGTVWDPDAPSGQWPVVVPPSAPVASGGYSRWVVLTVVGGAAAVGVAVSLVVTLGFGVGSDDHKHAAPASTPATFESSAPSSGSSPSSTSTDLSEESTTDTPTPIDVEPPSGYVSYDDPQGFRIAVPDGWQRSTVGSQYGMDIVNYRSDTGDRRLQVYEVEESSPDASFQLYLSSAVPKPPGFQELALDHVDTAGVTGTRLEYLAASLKGEPDNGTWHVYDERFGAVDGRIYAIASYGPAAGGGDDELAMLNTALDWFCPPEQTCPAPTS